MRKIQQTGRSLLETIAVLVIIAVIVLSAVFLFNTLLKEYQRKDTVKTMDTIATRYRSTSLMRKRNGQILLKDIIPGAVGDSVTAADGSTFTLKDADNSSTFVIIKKGIQPSCRDILDEKNFDIVGYGDTDTGYTAPTQTYSSKETISEAQLMAICDPAKYQYFYYNKSGSATGGKIIGGVITDCPAGEVLAIDPDNTARNICCDSDNIKAGYCGKCPNGLAYDSASDTCMECTKDADCRTGGTSNSGPRKYFCDTTKHRCVQCIYNNNHQKCDNHWWEDNYWCGSDNQCNECTEGCGTIWTGVSCHIEDKSKLGESCTGEPCCEDGLKCEGNICVINPDGHTCLDYMAALLGAGSNCAPYEAAGLDHGCCQAGLSCTDGICKSGSTCPSPLLGKGTTCSTYAGYDNYCCAAGFVCEGTCQCSGSGNYGAPCNAQCTCTDGLTCTNNVCSCPEGKKWNSTTRQCECKTTEEPSDKTCFTKTHPYPTVCPDYFEYVPKTEGTNCGECKQCNATGVCVDYMRTLSEQSYLGNCCKSAGTTFCSLDMTPEGPCTSDKTSSSTDTAACQTTTITNLCTNTDSYTYPNNGASCGECEGVCTNGTCVGGDKQSYSYFKDVSGTCTQVTEMFCPANAPSDQCTCPTSETPPTTGCYDTIDYPAANGCPAYTTYTTKDCVTPGEVVYEGGPTGGTCARGKSVKLYPGYYEVIVIGAGGGSAAYVYDGHGSSNYAGGGIGGSGASFKGVIKITSEQTVSITIGQGGYRSACGQAGTGGTSSIGNMISCPGGYGASGSSRTGGSGAGRCAVSSNVTTTSNYSGYSGSGNTCRLKWGTCPIVLSGTSAAISVGNGAGGCPGGRFTYFDKHVATCSSSTILNEASNGNCGYVKITYKEGL